MKSYLTATLIIILLSGFTYITVAKASMYEPEKPKNIMGPEFGPRPDCEHLSDIEWQECMGVGPK